MLRVCSIVFFIEKHWTGPKIDWALTKKLALVHDLGNLVRFDLEKHSELLEEEQPNIEYWKLKKEEMKSKYGSDDHEATFKMLMEIDISDKAIEAIGSKSFVNVGTIKDSTSWPLKLLFYSDLRTMPFGIGSLKERNEELQARRPDLVGRPDFVNLVKSCFEIEMQIQKYLDCGVSEINDRTIKIDESFLQMRFD